MPKAKKTEVRFSGYSKPNYTMVPDELFDEQLPYLSGAELKVLLYIIRRTFGFKKDSDEISFNQICKGITKKDGEILDQGTGLSSSTAQAAIKGLIEKNLIVATRRMSQERGNEPTIYSLNLTGPYVENRHSPSPKIDKGLYRKSPTQNTDIQETVKQDIYPSNIRKAKSEDLDYVNSNSSAEEASESARSTQNDEVGHGQNRSSTNRQNIEKIESEKNPPPPAPRAAAQPSSTAERNRNGGLAHIGQALQDQLPITPPATDDAVARDAIERYIRDTAAKLHDEAPLKSSVTRAWNDYKRSGVDLNRFFNELYDAEKEANRRSATIKKLTKLGFKNRMAYFYAILESNLGLREKALPNGPQSP